MPTALADAFANAGLKPEEVEFSATLSKAITRFKNRNGDVEKGCELLDMAKNQLCAADQSGCASDGHRRVVDGAQPELIGGDHSKSATSRQSAAVAAGQSKLSAADQDSGADNGHMSTVGGAQPKPTPSRLRAVATAHRQAALTMFDTIKTTDGRAWGDVGAHELDGMERDGMMARAIRSRIGVLTNKQRFMKVRQLLKEAEFSLIVAEVRRAA